MAPKVEQPAVSDIPAILTALQGDEQDKVIAALSSLFTLDAGQLTQDASGATEVCSALQALLAPSHAAEIRCAAIRCMARLISMDGSAYQQSLMSESSAKAAWAFLSDLDVVWVQYMENLPQVLAAAATARAEQAGKKPTTPAAGKPGAAAPTDPEAALPGPTKQMLDAALRVLCILAAQDTARLLGWLPGTTTSYDVDSSNAEHLQALARLLSYHSPRIQCRAAQLCAVLMAALPHACATMLRLGLVPDLCRLLSTSGHACVRLRALQALRVLLRQPSAAHTQLLQAGSIPALLQLVAAAASVPAAATASSWPAPGTPATIPASRPITPLSTATPSTPVAASDATSAQHQTIDLAQPFPTSMAELQIEALRVLTLLTHLNQAATEQAVQQGGVQLLLAMLPPAPAQPAPAAAAPSAAAPNLAPQVTGQTTSSPAQPDVDAGLSSGKSDANVGLEAEQQETSSASQDCAKWQAYLASPPPMVPALPSTAAQVQASKLLANLISVPGVQAVTFHHQQALDEIVAAADIATQASNAAQGAVDPAAAAAPNNTDVEGPLLPLLAQMLALFAGAPAAPPSPTPELTKAAPKPGKSGNKAEEPAAPPHLLAPFPVQVRAAALHVLAAACHHPGWANRVASHPHIIGILRGAGQHLPTENPHATDSRAMAGVVAPGSTTATSAQSQQQHTALKQCAEGASQTVPAEQDLLHGVAALAQALGADKMRRQAYASAHSCQDTAGTGVMTVKHDDSEASAPVDQILSIAAMLAKVALADKQQAAASDTREGADYLLRTAVASCITALPDAQFIVVPRPPLPSPPPTPPPLPLATTMFLWDALDRPAMADGSVKLVHM